jgi:hypothetical protein
MSNRIISTKTKKTQANACCLQEIICIAFGILRDFKIESSVRLCL